MGSIGLIIWNRLIRVRLPREIEGELWSMEFWIILYLLILFFLMFIYACNKLQKKLRGIPEGRFVKRLEEKYPRLISYFEKKLQFIRTYILIFMEFLLFSLPRKCANSEFIPLR